MRIFLNYRKSLNLDYTACQPRLKRKQKKNKKEKYGMHTVKHINEVAVSGGKGRIELDLNLCFFESVDVLVF